MQQRKRHADHDALLLQNRINLLRKEEAKVCKVVHLVLTVFLTHAASTKSTTRTSKSASFLGIALTYVLA